MKILLWMAGIAAFLSSANGWALEKKEAKALPCQSDMLKLCANVPPGETRKIECLRQHKDELSPECRERILEWRQGRDSSK